MHLPLSMIHQMLVGSSSCLKVGLPSLSEYLSRIFFMYSTAPDAELSRFATLLLGRLEDLSEVCIPVAISLPLLHNALRIMSRLSSSREQIELLQIFIVVQVRLIVS